MGCKGLIPGTPGAPDPGPELARKPASEAGLSQPLRPCGRLPAGSPLSLQTRSPSSPSPVGALPSPHPRPHYRSQPCLRGIQLPASHTLGGLHALAGPQNLHLSRMPDLGGWALLPTGVCGCSWLQPHSGWMFLRVTGFRAAGEGAVLPAVPPPHARGREAPTPSPPPQSITMVWGGLPETISGWAGLLGWGGGP